jgi:hypothetical protein
MKIKLELLDPTGVVIECHGIEYIPKNHYRAYLTIGDYHYYVKDDGKTLERLEPLDIEEELTAIADWLKSKTGQEIMKKSQLKTSEVEKLINKMKDIDPKDLTEPFNI